MRCNTLDIEFSTPYIPIPSLLHNPKRSNIGTLHLLLAVWTTTWLSVSIALASERLLRTHESSPSSFVFYSLGFALDMNQLNAATFPVRLCISFKLRGDLISTIAQIFSGFASIP